MASTYQLGNFLRTVDTWGLTDVLLPFLLIFTLVFAILQKTKILGEDKKNFNVVIALVMALTVVIPHATGGYPINYDPVNIINAFLPGISLVIVAVVMLFVLIGLWGGEANWVGGTPSAMIAILAAIAVIWIFGAAANWWTGWNWFTGFFGEDAVALVIIILVFAIIIWFITKSDKQTSGENFLDKVGNMFMKK
tara:strand:+ start:75 stop:656 length:582 start_codon:yes stop_codon:yes gene_type:complete